jgi:hypothetical protein
MLNRTRSKTGLVFVALLGALPLMLTTPASADGPSVPPPPVTIQIGPPPTPDPTGELTNVGGVTSMYDPPPDDAVSDDALGNPTAQWPVPYFSVEDPGSPAESPAPSGDCRWYETARWFEPDKGAQCPAPFWRGRLWWVEDQTHVAWPVKAAVEKWNAGMGASMHIGYGCKTIKGRKYHCVQVVQDRYGSTKPKDWVGLAKLTIDPESHEILAATIQLNDTYRMGSAGHMQAIVHELGHVAGLGHEMTNVGPMWDKDDGQHETPNSAEYGQLIYHNYNFA